MSKNQKNVLVGAISLIVAMLVYPPFQYTGEHGVVTNMGYDWIFSPPRYRGSYNAQANVNVPVLFIQWLGVILVSGLGFYLTKEPSEPCKTNEAVESQANVNEGSKDLFLFTGNPVSSADVQLNRGPVGVGGWLVLLITGLMILGPLGGAGRLYGEIATLERTYPNLISVSEWSTYKSAVSWIFLGSAAISFWGGLRLSWENNWSAVENAIAALWISGPGAAVLIGVLVPVIIFDKASFTVSDIIAGLVWSIITASVWTVYLLKSRRVGNTFQKDPVHNMPFLDRYCTSNLMLAIVGVVIVIVLLVVITASQRIDNINGGNSGENIFAKKSKATRQPNMNLFDESFPSNNKNIKLPILTDQMIRLYSSSSSKFSPEVNQKSTVEDIAFITNEANADLPVIMDKERRVEGAVGFMSSSEVTQLEIKKIQSMLKVLGYTPGPADGKSGSRTQFAIRQFESDAGLNVTGNPSAELLRILESRFDSNTARSNIAVKKYRIPDLHDNNFSETVGVQNKLKQLGYYNGEISGVVDSETSNAIMRYQQANNIIPSNEPGQVDFNILRALRHK